MGFSCVSLRLQVGSTRAGGFSRVSQRQTLGIVRALGFLQVGCSDELAPLPHGPLSCRYLRLGAQPVCHSTALCRRFHNYRGGAAHSEVIVKVPAWSDGTSVADAKKP